MSILLSDIGLFRVGSVSPELRVGDVAFNTEKIIAAVEEASDSGCRFTVFPELSVTGYTCGDLFFQSALTEKIHNALMQIADCSAKNHSAIIVGAPIISTGMLFNCAVVIIDGDVKAVIPKTYLSNNNEFYEKRWFASDWNRKEDFVTIAEQDVPFGADILFRSEQMPFLRFGIEICEDLWALVPPSFDMAAAGASMIVNLSASNEVLSKYQYRRELVLSQSARCHAAYVYSGSGAGESTTDLAFSGHCMISEYGNMLAESPRFGFDTKMIFADIDFDRLNIERIRNNTFAAANPNKAYRIIRFSLPESQQTSILREIPTMPFVPSALADRADSCREIFSVQTTALAKRLKHIPVKDVVIGVSGGLDSALALVAAVKAFEILRLDLSGIHAVSMPGFGTSKRTKSNAEKLTEFLGLHLLTIPINKSVRMHFKDIGHDENIHDVVYENAQARERTQILMDLANKFNAIVIGTGDLSELALGWCTYNADHMSMYGVNSGIPKTLVRFIIEWLADEVFDENTAAVLRDICNTPVSPELLPTKSGNIVQKTEQQIGPYLLNDFFLYYVVRMHFAPKKILLMAEVAFEGTFSPKLIKSRLIDFYNRFFSQQFKRSCMPDGIKVGSVSLSPRGDWRMPSDASAALWINQLNDL